MLVTYNYKDDKEKINKYKLFNSKHKKRSSIEYSRFPGGGDMNAKSGYNDNVMYRESRDRKIRKKCTYSSIDMT